MAVVIAGVICVALGFGHAAVGRFWVLPTISGGGRPSARLGPSMTMGMVHVAWHFVTITALSIGVLLIVLATSAADAEVLLLRWVAGLFLVAAIVVVWRGRHRLRSVARFPVWVLWLVVAGLCLAASA